MHIVKIFSAGSHDIKKQTKINSTILDLEPSYITWFHPNYTTLFSTTLKQYLVYLLKIGGLGLIQFAMRSPCSVLSLMVYRDFTFLISWHSFSQKYLFPLSPSLSLSDAHQQFGICMKYQKYCGVYSVCCLKWSQWWPTFRKIKMPELS